MPIPLIPVGVVSLIGIAAYRVHQKKKRAVLTPQRKQIFETAMNTSLAPEKYEELARSFDGEGLSTEAELLRKRAKLAAAPPEIKEARRAAYKKAFESTNKSAIMQLAEAFQKEGAIGAARSLRKYASDLIPNLKKAGEYQRPADVDPVPAGPNDASPAPAQE